MSFIKIDKLEDSFFLAGDSVKFKKTNKSGIFIGSFSVYKGRKIYEFKPVDSEFVEQFVSLENLVHSRVMIVEKKIQYKLGPLDLNSLNE